MNSPLAESCSWIRHGAAPQSLRRQRSAQAGFVTLIGAVFLMAVLALVIAFGAQMAGSDVRDSEMVDENTEALILAESGLEQAVSRLGANQVTCGAVANTQNLGRGSFTVLAGLATDLAGAPLAAGRCRIQVIGRVPLTNVARAIEGISAIGGISFDNTGSNWTTTGPLTWNHTVGTNINRLLVVGVALRSNAGQQVTAVTYGGVALQRLVQATNGNDTRIEFWFLTNPTPGTAQVSVTWSNGDTRVVGGSVSFAGVNQAIPFDGTATNTGNNNAVTATVATSMPNAWVMDAVASRRPLTMTAAATRLQRWNLNTSGNAAARLTGAGSTRGPIAVAGNTTMNWTANGGNPRWSIAAIGIRPHSTVIAWREIPVP